MMHLLNNRENWVRRNLAARMNERLRKASLRRTNTGVRSERQRASQQGAPRKDSWEPGGALEEKKGRGHVMRSDHKELCKSRNFMKSNRVLYKVVI